MGPPRMLENGGQSCSYRKLCLSVDLLNIGSLVSGRLWYNKQTIFPKGFRSRVEFFNVLNPNETTSYISEVLDAGFLGPLFKVTLEKCPSESFSNFSADKCWEMVLEKLNKFAISQQNINGLEMFGFLSSSIVQDIEALDSNHQCIEYWDDKQKPKDQIIENNNQEPPIFSRDSIVDKAGMNPCVSSTINQNSTKIICSKGKEEKEEDIRSVLRGLLNKANPEELKTMHRIMCSDSKRRVALATITDEIQKKCK
jgi:histone demethylase JARID1